jgi:hypothetical protein
MHCRKHYAGAVVFGCAVAVIGTHKATGQEALRRTLESDASAALRNQPVVRPSADVLQWGPATFDISVSYSLEATDNARFARTDRREDLIQRPLASIGVLFQLSPQSRLDFRTGVGYEDYIDNSVEDRLFITPGSELAIDVRVGSAVVTFFDRFDYSQDVVQEGALSGVGRFPRLENTVGLRSVWQFDRWVYQAGYSHLNVFIVEDDSEGATDFSYLERADEQFFGRAGYNFDYPVQLGVEATGSLSDYTSDLQRDRYTISAGPYLRWNAAEALEIALRGGATHTVFSGTNGRSDETDFTSLYLGFNVDHRLTDHVTYGFSVTHDIRAGVALGSDYIETTRAELNTVWRMTPHWTLSANVFGETSEEVGLDSVTEAYRRLGIGVGPIYQLTRHVSCFARYAFNLRDSDIESRSYRENRVSIGASYRF